MIRNRSNRKNLIQEIKHNEAQRLEVQRREPEDQRL
jgi:hypothetical protein